MLDVLQNRIYRRLFSAQVIALVGTGLMTVALGLLAYDLAKADAGAVLGTALAIKMIAYVGIAPIAQAFADRVPRRTLLVVLDLIRASVAVCLPFVTEIWQIYLLIFVLQTASASFTPTFQATIPDILPNEEDYTKALSLSRLAYDLESLISPMLAAALLTAISFHNLFTGTVVGFLISAALVVSVTLPATTPGPRRGIWERTTRGIRIYLATPRLRGLLAICLAVSAAGAMVLVNTVVIVKARFGLGEAEVAWALAAFGGGSMIAALTLPRILEKMPDRPVMVAGAAVLVIGTASGSLIPTYSLLLLIWFVIGFGYSAAQTPSGRLLRRSAHAEDRPTLFAAQFALSHAAWLLCYPLAGRFGAAWGLQFTFIVMSLIGFFGVMLALKLWPAGDSSDMTHDHPDLPPDHPHLRKYAKNHTHCHTFVVDDLHRAWPQNSGA
ncbi:MFS transporter [Comamonas sp. Y6]|uniref:MFS transporter n=1 Tax=Comamonas resistens TaxID=3046670 RepID=A0ABY8SQ87_9BURK|nr:MFS transporter [Comamonas resistens]MDL5035823.1 MFS transporter [Comamonas resistens]WHS65233.1 MFS transporter [Comamonas resistens]HBP0978977.1 MFS transporter [Pseudomonas aeruginosa]